MNDRNLLHFCAICVKSADDCDDLRCPQGPYAFVVLMGRGSHGSQQFWLRASAADDLSRRHKGALVLNDIRLLLREQDVKGNRAVEYVSKVSPVREDHAFLRPVRKA